MRARNAQALEIDAAFLTRRSRPTDERGEAFANKGEPCEIPARFTGQQGGPITLPSSPHDERGEPHSKRAAFLAQPGRLPTQSARLTTQPGRPTTRHRTLTQDRERQDATVGLRRGCPSGPAPLALSGAGCATPPPRAENLHTHLGAVLADVDIVRIAQHGAVLGGRTFAQKAADRRLCCPSVRQASSSPGWNVKTQ
jgi:hypothetical protein